MATFIELGFNYLYLIAFPDYLTLLPLRVSLLAGPGNLPKMRRKMCNKYK